MLFIYVYMHWILNCAINSSVKFLLSSCPSSNTVSDEEVPIKIDICKEIDRAFDSTMRHVKYSKYMIGILKCPVTLPIACILNLYLCTILSYSRYKYSREREYLYHAIVTRSCMVLLWHYHTYNNTHTEREREREREQYIYIYIYIYIERERERERERNLKIAHV